MKDGPGDSAVAATMRQLAIAAFASGLSMRICDPMLPQLMAQFDGSLAQVSPVVTVFAIAYGVFCLVHGPIGDRLGKLRVVAIAAQVCAVASIACALAPSLSALIAFRFLAGAACAAIIPLALAWIGDSVDFGIRQQTLARFGAAAIAGLIAGQVVGGVFADTLGWRSAFAVPTVLFVVAGLLIGRRTRHEPDSAGLRTGPAQGFVKGYYLLIQNRWARFLMICALLEGALAFGVLAFVPSYLHDQFDIALWQAGLMVAAYGVGGLLLASFAKSIIPRLGEVRMAVLGGTLVAIGFGAIASAWHPAVVVFACCVAGFGFTMMHNTLQSQATQSHPAARGTAIAGFALCLFSGQSLGVAGSAMLIQGAGYSPTFLVFSALIGLLGLVVSRGLARHAVAVNGP